MEREFEVQSFAGQEDLHAWLDAHGASAPGLYVLLAKKSAAFSTITWAQLVEVLLCHGWIDGRGNRYDDTSWTIRVTPRRARSVWSQKNVETVDRLIASGQMRPAGLVHVETAQADGRWAAAYGGSAAIEVPEDLIAALDAVPGARSAFEALNRTARYSVLFRVQTAAKAATRAARIARAVAQLTPAGEPDA